MRKTAAKSIGALLEKRRKALGISREALAKKWDRSLSTVRNWCVELSEPKGHDREVVEKWLAENNGRKGK